MNVQMKKCMQQELVLTDICAFGMLSVLSICGEVGGNADGIMAVADDFG